MHLVHRPSLLGAAIVALGALACNAPAPPDEQPRAAGTVVIPTTPPSIRGVITDEGVTGGATPAAGGRMRVEEHPADASGSPKAVVTWDARTRLARRDGAPATADELARGVVVRVWFDGPVMESYPVQARAGVIVVE